MKSQDFSPSENKLAVKLSAPRKICYGLGDTANAFSWNLISSFLMIFYTDVFQITPYAVSALFLISRFWDAVNDPIVGALADRTHSKMGRYRPWILFSCLPLALCTVLVFWAHPQWAQPAKIIYAFVTYGLVVLAYTCVNIPYTALASALTQDSHERGSLASYRMALALLGALLTAQLGARLVPVLAGDTGDFARGYLLTAVLLVCMAIPLYLILVAGTREVVTPSAPLPRHYLRSQLKASVRNQPLILTIVAHFLVGLTIYGRMAVVTYYFTYNINDPALVGTFFIFMQVPMMIGSFLSQYLSNWVKSKGRMISVSFILYGVLSVVNFFITPMTDTLLFWSLLAVANFFNGIGYALTYAIIPDTVEYNELHTGVRNDGVAASLTSFWNKVGMAIGTSATAAVLGALNYVPGAIQSAVTLNSINCIMFIVPGVAAIGVGILFFWYKLDYAKFDEIVAQLKANKTNLQQ